MGDQFSYKIITPDGVTFDLDPSQYVVDLGMDIGLGLPPIAHATQSLYQQPGALLKSIQIQPRIVTITLSLNGTCRSELHQLRAALWDSLRWNRTTDAPPAYSTLRYESDLKQANLHVYYAGDIFANLGGDDKVGLDGIKLIAYDPAWYGTTQVSTALDLGWSETVSYIVGKIAGAWNDMGNPAMTDPGTGIIVIDFALGADGDTLYVAGNFLNLNGIANADYIASYKISTGVWSALGTGMNGNVLTLAISPDGSLYAGGNFTTAGGGAASRIAKWNGAAWSALASGFNSVVQDICFAPDGTLYATGLFTTSGATPVEKIAKWNGIAWSALGAGLDQPGGGGTYGTDLVSAPNGDIYVTGVFTHANSVSAANIAKWNGTTFVALGSGLNSDGYRLLYARNGMLYAGGNFTAAGGVTASKIAMWNGTTWIALGAGVGGGIPYAISENPDGSLYVGGAFTSAGGSTLSDRIAQWNGSAWSPLDVDLPGAPTVYSIRNLGGNLFIGFNTSGAASTSGTITIPYNGDMIFFPLIEITGPGTLRWIENYELGKRMMFNCFINAGETATIDLSPGVKTLTSNWRGNLLPYATLLPLSDFGTFALAPDPIAPLGVNSINVWMTGTTVASSGVLKHYNAYLSADKAVT